MSKPTVVETNPHAAFARDVPSLPPTTDLDSLVEMLESAIVEHGLDAVSLATFGQRALQDGGDDAHDWLVELFRVWLEHAWMRGRQLTPSECLSLFPHITLSPHQLETLEFEYQRLRRTSHSIASQQRNQRPVALPDVGTRWANFELLQSLGTGAYSHVYLARQTDFANRLVALKLTSQQTSESATLARLQHTAIVPVFSTYVHQQLYGICMPYLGNTTLADFVTSQPRGTEATAERRTTFSVVGRSLLETLSARQSRITTIVTESPGTPDAHQKAAQVEPTPTGATSFLPVTSLSRSPAAKQLTSLNSVETILWIVAQVADGLAHAHRHKVLHCDIKPANILLGADGQPRLLDFNISLDASKRGQPRGLGGTPAYMAPNTSRPSIKMVRSTSAAISIRWVPSATNC